jgi:hypothetical protein
VVRFLAEAICHFLGSFAKLADGFTGAAAHLRQLATPKKQESDHDNDHNVDRLESEWHLKFLSTIISEILRVLR